jgi:hypothetical protein
MDLLFIYTVQIMILSRYRYRDAFFEAFFYLLTKLHLRTYIIILETWLSAN